VRRVVVGGLFVPQSLPLEVSSARRRGREGEPATLVQKVKSANSQVQMQINPID
jgi:hypothetical protein